VVEASAPLLVSIPAVRQECKIAVAIPASNEEATIEAALTPFVLQYDSALRQVAYDSYEIIVFVNRSYDETARRARAFKAKHPEIALHVLEQHSVDAQPHAGHARGAVMALAAERMTTSGRRGIVATTDADSRVGDQWIAATLRALSHVDAVGGHIIPDIPLDDLERTSIERDQEHRNALVRLETLLDPVPWDPWPRHGNHQGASLALHALAFNRVGGVPLVPVLEDLGLYRALLLEDLRFKHDLGVKVITSTRRTGRVPGGFASDLEAIDAHLRGQRHYLVENPGRLASSMRARGMIRKLWLQRSHSNIELEALAGEALQIEPKDVRLRVNACRTAGRAIAHFKLDPWRRDHRDDLVPFDQALEIVTMLARNPATIEPFVDVYTHMER